MYMQVCALCSQAHSQGGYLGAKELPRLSNKRSTILPKRSTILLEKATNLPKLSTILFEKTTKLLKSPLFCSKGPQFY